MSNAVYLLLKLLLLKPSSPACRPSRTRNSGRRRLARQAFGRRKCVLLAQFLIVRRLTSLRNGTSTLVPPSRYSRKPDPSIPPLRLDRASNPFDDDHFISSWINLMQPASRDEAFVPKDFLAPTPFDLSHRANNPSAPPNHTQDHSYQNWASYVPPCLSPSVHRPSKRLIAFFPS